MSQKDSDRTSNRSGNRHFSEIVEINRERRQLLVGGFGAGALAFFGTPALAHLNQFEPSPAPGFTPITADVLFGDSVRVPSGYKARVVYRWGDATGIPEHMPDFATDGGVSLNTAEDQAFQAGQDHDGMHFFPLDSHKGSDRDHRGRHSDERNRGLLVMNHENIQPEFLLGPNLSDADRVLKMKNAHGISVVEVRQRKSGQWELVRPSRYARRITADTPIRISGPAAGDALMKTSADPTGKSVLGTLNNCANGFTPWGTYLTCEENFNGYFDTTAGQGAITQHMKRYGVAVTGAPFGYNWHLIDARFDAAQEPNESNRFGWVMEVDPRNPDHTPVKRTALGRFKHENAAAVLADDGRVVVYLGDDERNEYIYKFVSERRCGPRHEDNQDILDRGTLYVAIFEPGSVPGDGQGTGRWVPLQFGKNGLTPANGFASQAEVLIKTRQAADRVGATMMDRPEWIAVHPRTREVYITLTNNNRRGSANPPIPNNPDGTTTAGSARPAVDEANPRANNVYGHILRWREKRGDPAALTFNWDVYLLAGDPADPGTVGAAAVTNTVGYPGFEAETYRIFSAPDGLAFDPQGWLWIETDYSASQTGVQTNMGNCHMMLADIPSGRIGRFLTGPNGCEITGWTMTPDRRSLFINIQHPGEGGSSSNPTHLSTWPDGTSPPRSSTIVITKDDGGVIGT